MPKRYIGEGFDTSGPGTVTVVDEDTGTQRTLDTGVDNPDLPSHSPDGFQVGYTGSGPAQLAAALLHDVYDADTSNKHYQQFKNEVIANLPDEWSLTEERIREWASWNT